MTNLLVGDKSIFGYLRNSASCVAAPSRSVMVGLLLGSLLLAWALNSATPKPERTVYSDLATHVMIASSLWEDGDLAYKLEDLTRFRQDYPRAEGPYGLFLKLNKSDELYFAKPYLYGVVAAPFYGVFNIDGFIIFSVLCLVGISVVVWRPVSTSLGKNWALFASVSLLLPSAFLPWLFVPHPDIFIATLLAIGIS